LKEGQDENPATTGFALRIVATSLALVSCYLAAAPVVRADQLKIKCQVAIYTGEPVGAYEFLFDTTSSSLSVALQPAPRRNLHSMYGYDVKNWKLLLARGGHAVFYDISP
jgi:hypothetical protein